MRAHASRLLGRIGGDGRLPVVLLGVLGALAVGAGGVVAWTVFTPAAPPPPRIVPVRPPAPGPPSNVVGITAGNGRACAVRSTGRVACWGWNLEGALGDGNEIDSARPVAVRGLRDAIAVSGTGNAHVCALRRGGRVACWGSNEAGELGDGTRRSSPTPVMVKGLHDAVAVSAGSWSCALRAGGTVACWGSYPVGETSAGGWRTTASLTPVAVAGLGRVVGVSVGGGRACAVRRDGEVMCWGSNDLGALGTGLSEDQMLASPPVAVRGLHDAVAVSVGSDTVCALRRSGGVACWGQNFEGQLGYGASSNGANAPVQVRGLHDAIAVDVGESTVCALRGEGSVSCWGDGSEGELGDATRNDSMTPVGVEGLADATAIAVGRESACALRPHGRVLCWGSDLLGDLGNGRYRIDGDPALTTPHPVVGL